MARLRSINGEQREWVLLRESSAKENANGKEEGDQENEEGSQENPEGSEREVIPRVLRRLVQIARMGEDRAHEDLVGG